MEFRDVEEFIAWIKNEKVDKLREFFNENNIVFTEEKYNPYQTAIDQIIAQLVVYGRVYVFDSADKTNDVSFVENSSRYYATINDCVENSVYPKQLVEWGIEQMAIEGFLEWE